MSLSRKATSGSIWTSITRAGVNAIDFLVFAYLARVLSLEEFGLVGFCYLFVEFANTIVDSGVNQNLVQRKNWEDRYAASTMTFVSILGLLAVLAILVIAVPIAFYVYSELAAIVLASLAPIVLITSFQVVITGKLLREFKNKEMGKANLASSIISSGLIIYLAESGLGLWALVIGKLINALIQYLFLLFISQFRPYFNFDKNDSKELIDFCLPLLGMTVLSFIHRKVAVLFTGLVLGPVSFALLAAARRGEVVINQITLNSMNAMVVPSFSRVNDVGRLGQLYVRMVSIAAILVFPIFMGIAAIADPLVVLAFGSKFEPSAEYMMISAFAMFPTLVAWFLPNLLISIAKTKDAFYLTILSISSSLLVAGATIWFGVKVMLICIAVSRFIVFPIRLYIVKKHITIGSISLLKSLLPASISSLAMFILLLETKNHIKPILNNEALTLIILIFEGVIIYPLILFTFFNKNTNLQVSEIKKLVNKKTRIG